MTERIADHARALSVERVGGGAQHGGSGGQSACYDFIGVVDVYMQADAGARRRIGTDDAMLRIFVAEHQRGAAELQFGMADAAARFIQTEQFGGAEDLAIEIDRFGGIADSEVRN